MADQNKRATVSELPDFDKLWDYHEPAATEKAFREILPTARSSGNEAYLAELLTQIARTQGLQRQFDQAHATLDEVEAMIDDSMPVPRIRYLLERGRTLNSSQQVDEAKPLFQLAWELAQREGEEFYAVDAAHMLGIVEPGDVSLQWNEIAIKLAEQSADARANHWLGSLYNNTGWTYHGLERYDDALGMFQKSLAFQQAEKDEKLIRIANWTIARTLRSLGRVEEALAKQRELLEVDKVEGAKDGYVYEEIAECLLLLDHADEAREYFALAHAELSQDSWLQANESDRLARLKRLGSQGE